MAYQPPANQLPPGTVLQGRYQLGKALGAGGFGITYLAWDTVLDRRVAVKEYYPVSLVWREAPPRLDVKCASQNETHYQKLKNGFLQEARTLSHMGNIPGVVQVYDFFEGHNTAYLVMEYLEGETLTQLVKRRGPLSMEALLRLLKPVFEALEAVHNAGMIHRDISPDNLMILKNGAAKVMDFGAAREMDGERTMTVILRYDYAPLEQYTGHDQGPWTDVYALCATIYYCLTGQAPPLSLERYGGSDPLQFPRALGVAITIEQEQALLKGLAVHPEQRWTDMSDLYKSLCPKSADKEKAFSTFSGLVIVPHNVEISDTLPPWHNNILMEDWKKDWGWDRYYNYFVFGSKITRKEVSFIVFRDTTINAPKGAWDVSQQKNRSVLAWVKKYGKSYHLYIAGNGGVTAPTVSSWLFAGYSALQSICFNGVFHTESAIDMSGMFCGCGSLTTLDISKFDTSKVTDMSIMFDGCNKLTALNVAGFDTSKVISMNGMFAECRNLTTLDISSFNTLNVIDMIAMFADCSSLTTVCVSKQFTTSQILYDDGCFDSCTSLVGGNGTAYYKTMQSDASYACIDTPEHPGYFTAKE